MYPNPNRRRCARRAVAAVAALLLTSGAIAADPPGSLPLDWPMGQLVGAQLVPGQNLRVMQNYANSNGDYDYRLHSALDLAQDSGSTINAPVYAAADGVVLCAVNASWPGWVVVIEHTLTGGGKLYTQYGHLNAPSVVVGQIVNRGGQIGTVTEWTPPPGPSNTHLHFEVRTFGYWSGSCAGPGYAPLNSTPDQHGWRNPINEYFQRRPAFPGQVVANVAQSVRATPNRSGGAVIASVAANTPLVADGVHADQGGGKEWWHRVKYNASQWGYVPAYWNDGWSGDLRSTEYLRYPGPVELADAVSSGGELYLFARRSDGATWLRRRSAAGSWNNWQSLDGNATAQPVAAVNSDGRVQVFARGTDSQIWTRRQSSAGSAQWDAWASVGGDASSAPAVVRNNDGRLQLFVRGPTGGLRSRIQASAGGLWNSWIDHGGTLHWGPAAALNSDGRVAVFVGGQSNDLFQIVQGTAGGSFGNFQALGGSISSHPSVVRNNDGRLEVFARGAAQDLRHVAQTSAGGAFGAWQSRGGVLTTHPHAIVHADGRIEVYARGGEGQLAHIYQITAGGSWASWGNLGGYLTSGVVPARQDNTVQIALLGLNGELYHRGYASPGGWSGWFSLGTGFGAY